MRSQKYGRILLCAGTVALAGVLTGGEAGAEVFSRNPQMQPEVQTKQVSLLNIKDFWRVVGAEYQYIEGLEEIGVTVLQNARVELEREGQKLILLGVDDPSHYPEDPSYSDADILALRISALQQENDGYTVLLSHRPELFDTYVSRKIDLALTGHAHGGQFRIPFLGGIAAPDQGLFPQYDAGIFQSDATTMIVSRGIGNSAFPFRVNNRPELVIVDLKKTG